MDIYFPEIYIPELAIPKLTIADFTLLGQHIKIGWNKITILKRTTIIANFKIMDTWAVVYDIVDQLKWIPEAVWDVAKTSLDGMAKDFYARHSTYEEYRRAKLGKEG